MEELDFEAAMGEPVYSPQIVENPDQVLINQELITTDVSSTAISLVPYQQKVKALIAQAQAVVVKDNDTRKQAAEIGLLARNMRRRVETIKQSPSYLEAKKYLKEVDALIKMITDPLSKEVEQIVKGKLKVYEERLILEQRRREAEAREEARVRQAALDEEARKIREEAEAKAAEAAKELLEKEAAGQLGEEDRTRLERTIKEEEFAATQVFAPVVATEVAPSGPEVVRTESGAAYSRRKFVARLVDPAMVEDKYKVIDMKLVQKDVDAGLRNIPGFLIEEEVTPVFR